MVDHQMDDSYRSFPWQRAGWVCLMVLVLLGMSSCSEQQQGTPRAPDRPPAGQIAFVSDRDGNTEIYVMQADGSQQTRLTTNAAEEDDPAWSPDGQRLAFTSWRDGNADIYVMQADGSQQTRLTTHPKDDEHPTWSPDGQRIAFVSNRDKNQEIYVMQVDGSQQTRLTVNRGADTDPAWSPDGQQIAFAANRPYASGIYVMQIDGSRQTRLSGDASSDSDPAWSPDGQRIVYTSWRFGWVRFRKLDFDSDLWVMQADGSQQTGLFDTADYDHAPTWSPDGQHIAFVSNHEAKPGIWVMQVDGRQLTNLTHSLRADTDTDTAPAWSPQ